jgi:MoaA/NifB/PqqE/SkfB family radical SAM enzyme
VRQLGLSTEQQYRMAPWVASRTYAMGTPDARAAISNEKRHEFLILEQESAELWHRIESGISHDALVEFAAWLGVEESLLDFLAELSDADLLTDPDRTEAAESATADSPPLPRVFEEARNHEPEHEMMQWVAEHGYLWSAFWEMTYRCNERCVHCWNPGAAHSPHETPQRETDELTTEEGCRLIDELAEVGVFRLTLSGGEVLLRQDFFDIVAHARRRGMSVAIYTNGLKLTPANLDRLAHLWPDSVGISIYSANPKIHDEITGVPGSFEKSYDALHRVHARGIKTYLKSSQMSHSVQGYGKVQQLALQAGAAPEIDLNMSATLDGKLDPMKLAVQDPATLIVMAATPGSPLFVGTSETNFGRVERAKDESVCGAGVGLMSIDPTGAIVPCSSLPIPIGTFRENGFKSIWLKSRVGVRMCSPEHANRDRHSLDTPSVLAAWQDVKLKDYRECGTHERCGWCNKCPGMALLEHGDVLAPSSMNCRLAMARMYAAKLLRAGKSLEEISQMLGVAEDFSLDDRPRPLPLIQLGIRNQTEVVPSEAAQRTMTQIMTQPNCSGGCSRCCDSTPHNSQFVSWEDRGVVELLSGSPASMEALESFANLRDTRLSGVDL